MRIIIVLPMFFFLLCYNLNHVIITIHLCIDQKTMWSTHTIDQFTSLCLNTFNIFLFKKIKSVSRTMHFILLSILILILKYICYNYMLLLLLFVF